jgi:hypothetical protein
MHYLLFRCIDIQQSNEVERTQALRLVRKVRSMCEGRRAMSTLSVMLLKNDFSLNTLILLRNFMKYIELLHM